MGFGVYVLIILGFYIFFYKWSLFFKVINGVLVNIFYKEVKRDEI